MNFDSLMNFLKPPKFLEMSSVAFDITDKFIRFVELEKRGNGIIIKKIGEKMLPEGVFSGGDILKKQELISILSELKKEHNFELVRISIPEEKSYIFITDVPRVSKKEIRQMLEFRLEENVPLKVEESIFEYSLIDENTENNFLRLDVSVVPKQIIDSYAEVFIQAGLTPISFKTESRAVARAVIGKGEHGTILIMNIKDNSTILSIVVDGTVWFTSTISVGTSSIIEMLKKGSIVKQDSSYKIVKEVFNLDDEKNADVFDLSINIFAVLRDSIVKFSEFWQNQSEKYPMKDDKIDKVILCGSVSAIPGFARYLSSSLNLQVEVANVWQNVFSIEKTIPEVDFVDSLNFSDPIGISLGEIHK